MPPTSRGLRVGTMTVAWPPVARGTSTTRTRNTHGAKERPAPPTAVRAPVPPFQQPRQKHAVCPYHYQMHASMDMHVTEIVPLGMSVLSIDILADAIYPCMALHAPTERCLIEC